MKSSILAAALLLIGVQAMGQVIPSAANPVNKVQLFAPQKAKKKSNFSFVNMKCADEETEEEKLEAVPQSPPLDVDDPFTPGCNTWEINVTFDGDLHSGAKDLEVPLFDINYGIGNNLQLKYEVPMISQSGEEGSQKGFGNSEFGVKWMFYNNEQKEMAVSFYPQVEFNNPGSKSVEKGLAESGTVITLPIMISKGAGTIGGKEVTVVGNFGYSKPLGSDEGSSVTARGGIAMPIFNTAALMADMSIEQGLRTNPEIGRRERLVKLNIAIKKPINEHMAAYAAIGRSIYSTDGQKHLYVTAGVQLVLAPKKKR